MHCKRYTLVSDAEARNDIKREKQRQGDDRGTDPIGGVEMVE